MRDWRSTFFWLVLALVAVELCFVVATYVRDGSAGKSSQAAATAAPSPVVSALALAASPEASAAPPAAPAASPEPSHEVVSPSPSASPSPSPSPAPTPVPNPSPVHAASRTIVADSSAFAYGGRWEHIAGTWDGRLRGKSSRTFSRGATATLRFNGRFVRLYGVVGPGGGFGAVKIDGRPVKIVDFFAASKAAHRLVFRSTALARGAHRLTVAVVPDPKISGARTQYVNIDGAEYDT